MAYLHGAYGEIGESKVASVTQADVVPRISAPHR